MPKLPRASGDKHIAAFKRAGWTVNHVEGSHHILIKEGRNVHLSIPVHKNKTLGMGGSFEEAHRESKPHK